MKNDIAYNNLDFIPGGPEYPARWASAAAAYRAREASIGRARLNHAYGAGERQKMDVFRPAGKAKGLVLFVHGGYWLKFGREYWSHFAAGLTERGYAVAMPSYTLAPEAQISAITGEIAQAVEMAAGLVDGPMVLTGHSAGGHLVARMLCRDVALPDATRSRIQRVIPISPVADLRPLLDTSMNADLKLGAAEAEAESPVLYTPPDTPVTVWVGADERPAFLDQARWLSEAWSSDLHIANGRHHFDVIDDLRDPNSALIDAFVT